MKHNWERLHAGVNLTAPQIEALLEPVRPGKRVVEAQRLGEGFSNTNYKIRLEDEDVPYVLRLYRSGRDIAEKERAIARRVRETVPVPAFRHADFSGSRFERPWALLEWKRGILLRDMLIDGGPLTVEAAASSVARSMAAIHAHTFDKSGFLNGSLEVAQEFPMDTPNFLAFMEQSLFAGKAGVWLGEENRQALWTLSRTYAPLLDEYRERPVLVHSDFNGLNILVDPDDPGCAVTAVLDWEFAFAGSRFADIGNLLRYEERGSPFATAFRKAYEQEEGALPREWMKLARLEDLIALSDLLNHSTDEMPVRIADLRRLIGRTLTEFATMGE